MSWKDIYHPTWIDRIGLYDETLFVNGFFISPSECSKVKKKGVINDSRILNYYALGIAPSLNVFGLFQLG